MKKLIRTIISVTMLASLSLNALGFHGGYFQHALESTKLVIEGEIQSDRELAMRTFSGNIDEDLRSW